MSTAPDPRQVSYLPLSSLAADPRNPKAHDQDTIDASIGRFGMLDLIVRDERTGYIVSGHGRHKALTGMMKRGESTPEGVKVDPETGEWLVPVVTGWASRTDAEAGAALIALNRTTELGGWVDDALLDLLDDLADVEGGFDGVGFTEEDRDSLQRITEGTPDLKELASEWEEGQHDLEPSEPVESPEAVIRVFDEEVAKAWRAFRDTFDSDDAALSELLP